MGDLTLAAAWYCIQNEAFSTSVQGSTLYTVRWAFQFAGPNAGTYDWECTCPAFQFRHKRGVKTCKHIDKVHASGMRCTWNAELDPGAQPDTRAPTDYERDMMLMSGQDPKDVQICPQCKGPVKSRMVGV